MSTTKALKVADIPNVIGQPLGLATLNAQGKVPGDQINIAELAGLGDLAYLDEVTIDELSETLDLGSIV